MKETARNLISITEIRLGIFDCLYGKSLVMKLLLKIPTKIDINYYGKMVPWLSLKLSQSRSGADLPIGQKPMIHMMIHGCLVNAGVCLLKYDRLGSLEHRN